MSFFVLLWLDSDCKLDRSLIAYHQLILLLFFKATITHERFALLASTKTAVQQSVWDETLVLFVLFMPDSNWNRAFIFKTMLRWCVHNIKITQTQCQYVRASWTEKVTIAPKPKTQLPLLDHKRVIQPELNLLFRNKQVDTKTCSKLPLKKYMHMRDLGSFFYFKSEW